MQLHPHHSSHNSSSIPTISVCGTEFPLPRYFQVIDLYNAGHNTDSILVHIVATTQVSSIESLHETVQNIIFNVQLMNNPSPSDRLSVMGKSVDEEVASRRNSRIEFVGELDDLDSARLMAEDKHRKEKERRTLRQLLTKLR